MPMHVQQNVNSLPYQLFLMECRVTLAVLVQASIAVTLCPSSVEPYMPSLGWMGVT